MSDLQRRLENSRGPIIEEEPEEEKPLLGLLNNESAITLIIGKRRSVDKRGFKNRFARIIFVSPTFRAQYQKLWRRLKPDGITVHEEVSDNLSWRSSKR